MDSTGVPMTPDNQKDGNETIAFLISQLDDPSIDNRHHAVLVLSESGDAAVQPLINALAAAGDNDRRWYRAISLSKLGVPAISPLIAAMEKNPDREFRRYAAAVLGEMGEPAVEPLIDAMTTEDKECGGFCHGRSAGSGNPRWHRSPCGFPMPMRSSAPAPRSPCGRWARPACRP